MVVMQYLDKLKPYTILLFFISSGVADGVGGWRDYGIDPSQFPCQLMKMCKRMVKEGHFDPRSPVAIIATSYQELLEHKAPLMGGYLFLPFLTQEYRGWLCTCT